MAGESYSSHALPGQEQRPVEVVLQQRLRAEPLRDGAVGRRTGGLSLGEGEDGTE